MGTKCSRGPPPIIVGQRTAGRVVSAHRLPAARREHNRRGLFAAFQVVPAGPIVSGHNASQVKTERGRHHESATLRSCVLDQNHSSRRLVPPGGATLPRAQMARPANGARLTLATWLQPRPDRPATIPLPPDVTVRIGRVDGQAPANSASVHTVGLNSREQAAVWKSRPMWPAGIHAAQAAAWPRLAEARGSLRHDLALTEASGEPAGRGLSHRVFHTGTLSTRTC